MCIPFSQAGSHMSQKIDGWKEFDLFLVRGAQPFVERMK